MRTCLALLASVWVAGTALAEDPFARAIGGSFALIDQFGQERTEVDPEGQAQLLFFGYANCPDICTAALPLMAEVVNLLDKQDLTVRPIMITVDPKVDTPETMGAPMERWHPRFVGLSGEAEALEASYEAFNVEIEPLFTDPAGQTIYAHGSFIYLLDGDGAFLTLIPPILGPDEAAKIVSGYLKG